MAVPLDIAFRDGISAGPVRTGWKREAARGHSVSGGKGKLPNSDLCGCEQRGGDCEPCHDPRVDGID
jgi:hypothetical protein